MSGEEVPGEDPAVTPESSSSSVASAAASVGSLASFSRLTLEQELLDRLESDLLACDAQVNLFESSAQSYKFDSVCVPYPPEFFHLTPGGAVGGPESEKNVKKLVIFPFMLHRL